MAYMQRDIPLTSTSQHDLVDKEAYTRHVPLPARRGPELANPATLGLFSFASTTFILSLFNLQTRAIHTPNVVVGMAIFCGGLAQLLAGMWEFPKGNTFGASAFTSYGAFWMSYATILLPGTGIIDAYKEVDELTSALGIFLTAWTLVTFFFLFVSFNKSVAFIALFGFLTLTFALLTAGMFLGSVGTTKTGGLFGVITAFVAYYIGVAELMAAEPSPFLRLPLGAFRR